MATLWVEVKIFSLCVWKKENLQQQINAYCHPLFLAQIYWQRELHKCESKIKWQLSTAAITSINRICKGLVEVCQEHQGYCKEAKIKTKEKVTEMKCYS